MLIVEVVWSVCSAITIAGPTPAHAQPSARASEAVRPAIVIRNATIIDARSRDPRPRQSVLIRDGRIVAVGPSVTAPRDAQVLNAAGSYLISGLWDMHVHTDVPGGRAMLEAYLYSGVTGVRDLAGRWDTLTAWRRDIAAGRLRGPRIVASGPYLDGNDQPIPHIRVRTAADARAAVDSLRRLGVDVVKLHTGLTRDAYFAAARRARELNLPFTGHVPRAVTTTEAADSGQRSIEHLLTIPTPCTPAESAALAPRFPVQRVFGPCTSQSLGPIFAALVRTGTWVTPTYVAQFEIAVWPTRAVPGDAYAPYLPDTLRKFVAAIFPMPDSIPPGADVVGRAMYDKRVALAGAMVRAGVHLLAGTDAPLRNSPPGFGLAAELAELERGGVPPFDVLRIATWEPARYLAATDSMGTVEPGKVADLVLLRDDPLKGAAAYRSVTAVVADGRLYSLRDREQMLARLKAAGR